jgi:hypothetical protein
VDLDTSSGKAAARYEYDVFLSYSRAGGWSDWVIAHFRPIVQHWLTSELGREAQIFQDTRDIVPGDRWPERIENALGSSKIMIALLSRNYFSSEWCVRELGSMYARAEHFRENGLSGRIIFPVAIHDSDPNEVPELVRSLEIKGIQDFCDPFMHPKGDTREQLSSALRAFCRHAAMEIESLPANSAQWRPADPLRYVNSLHISFKHQTSRPSLGSTT